MIDVSREPDLTLWGMMTTPLLAEAMKSMIRGVGMGELNIISIHLIAEGKGTDTYETTPLGTGGRVSYKETRSVDRDS